MNTASDAETTAEIQAAAKPADPQLHVRLMVERVPPLDGRDGPAVVQHKSVLSIPAMLGSLGGPRAALSRVVDRVAGQVIDAAVGNLVPEAGGDAAGSRCVLDDRFGMACDGPAGQVVILEAAWDHPFPDPAMAPKPVQLGVSAPVCGAHADVLARTFTQGGPAGVRPRLAPIGGVQR